MILSNILYGQAVTSNKFYDTYELGINSLLNSNPNSSIYKSIKYEYDDGEIYYAVMLVDSKGYFIDIIIITSRIIDNTYEVTGRSSSFMYNKKRKPIGYLYNKKEFEISHINGKEYHKFIFDDGSFIRIIFDRRIKDGGFQYEKYRLYSYDSEKGGDGIIYIPYDDDSLYGG